MKRLMFDVWRVSELVLTSALATGWKPGLAKPGPCWTAGSKLLKRATLGENCSLDAYVSGSAMSGLEV